MSSTTEVLSFLDIYTDVLDRVRESSTVTGTLNLAKKYSNQALVDMHVNPGNKFYWAERRGTLITHAPYSIGTVAIDVSFRTTVNGTSTLWTTAVTGFGFNNARAGGKMKINGSTDVHVVSSVDGTGTITLESVYTGATITGETYTYFEDEYALPSDFLRFVDLRTFSEERHISLIGDQDFRKWFGRNDIAGIPKAATHIQLEFSGTTSPRNRVVLSPHPNDEMQIPYWYVTNNLAVTSAGVAQARMSSDNDEPIVPRQYRHAIVFWALYHYYRDFKDDARSQEAKAEYVDLMTRVTGDTKTGQQRPRFIVLNRGLTPVRQRFDTGNRFDYLRDR